MSTGTSAWAPPTGGVPPQPAPPPNIPPYGWNPPPAGGAPGPVQQGTPRMWLWALVTAILMVVAIAATAAITYAIAHSAPSTSAAASAAPSAPTFTAAQQADAKQALCHTFDVSTAGSQSQGGARVNGQPNLPMLLRTLSSTVSIQNAIVPATPEDVTGLARRVVSTNLDLMNAALGLAKVDEVNRLTDASSEAIYALADACGLPH
jgi:hypothetical protein